MKKLKLHLWLLSLKCTYLLRLKKFMSGNKQQRNNGFQLKLGAFHFCKIRFHLILFQLQKSTYYVTFSYFLNFLFSHFFAFILCMTTIEMQRIQSIVWNILTANLKISLISKKYSSIIMFEMVDFCWLRVFLYICILCYLFLCFFRCACTNKYSA